MKKLLLAAMFCLGISTFSFAAGTSDYYVNDDAVEAAFTQSTLMNVDMSAPIQSLTIPTGIKAGEKTMTMAFVWSIIPIVGFIGYHRWYLGTSKKTKIYYCLTDVCVPVGALHQGVDAIILLIGLVKKESVDKYVDNSNYFIWKAK